MQGMFFTGNSVVEAINIDKVGPASGEVLLEMKASGVCGSDLKNFRSPKSDKPKQSDLKVPGHEPVGVVA